MGQTTLMSPHYLWPNVSLAPEFAIPSPSIYPPQFLRTSQIPVGMSAYLMHSNAGVYDRPEDFIPERWMGESVSPAMLKSFVPFAKGSRQCLGVK